MKSKREPFPVSGLTDEVWDGEGPFPEPIDLPDTVDRPIPEWLYPTIDTDLARDNLENDIPYADLQDL